MGINRSTQHNIDSSSRFDYIIVGGGTAGCVLANRLSADPAFRVLLVEAGPDFVPGAEPEAIADRGVRSVMLRQYFWPNLFATDGARPKIVMQAKVIGGGSTINGMHAQRGLPEDYDEWRQYGVQGWGWQDVLPYFLRLEKDTDFSDASHGTEGPLEIRRVHENQWSRLSKALRESLERRGLPRIRDVNSGGTDGVGAVPLNNSEERRISAAGGYLTASVRGRPNLAILASTSVTRILLAGKKAVGIELADGRTIQGGSIVVSCGAIHTPAMLMRSGIGPGSHLAEQEVTIVSDRAGVGQNLRAHPLLTILAHLKRQGRQSENSVRPPAPMVVRYSSGQPGCQPTDMMLNLWERNPGPLRNDPLNRQFASLMIILNKSYSQGEVRLASADRPGSLEVRGRLLHDPRDRERMVQGFLMVRDMLHEEPAGSLINQSFLPKLSLGLPLGRLTMKLLHDTLEARLISAAGALAVDYVPGVRGAVMQSAGLDIDKVPKDPDELDALIAGATSFGGHPGGTCKMGAAADPAAVVDSGCRVISVDNLRVVDASIFPTLMRGGTNLPVIMAAEKAADMIVAERGNAIRAHESRSVD